MRHAAILVAVLAVFGAARAEPGSARQSQVFRATSDVVPLFVTVLDKPGRLVTGLAKDDFQVFDNGRPQPLTVFESAPQPIRLIILIDVSGSMAGNGPLLGQAFSELINRLTPGDLARVGIFGRDIEITDRAGREDVMVYGVGVRSSLSSGMAGGGNLGAMMAATLPDPGLGTVADNTGGGYFELRPRDDLAATFARVVDELHQQYLLGFVPPARDGKEHKIDVRLRQSGLKARVRKTYRAPK